MNHTVSFIHAASPLMESIHKCSLIVRHTHTHTVPPQPAHTHSDCTHNSCPLRTAIASPTHPQPPDAPARFIHIRDKLKRSPTKSLSAQLARDNKAIHLAGFSYSDVVRGVSCMRHF